MILITRNNISGGLLIFQPTLEELESDNIIFGVHIEKGERNPSGNVGINCRYCAMLDEERNIFKDLWENRFYKTEHHEPTFSYFLRTT